MQLRKSDQIIYLNYYQDSILLLTSDYLLAMFDLEKNELSELDYPDALLERISIPKFKGGLSNKLKQGKPKFETLNSQLNFEIYKLKIGYLFSDP